MGQSKTRFMLIAKKKLLMVMFQLSVSIFGGENLSIQAQVIAAQAQVIEKKILPNVKRSQYFKRPDVLDRHNAFCCLYVSPP